MATNQVKEMNPDGAVCETVLLTGIHSPLLDREVDVQIFLPSGLEGLGKKVPLLILNDGQDSAAVKVKETLARMWGDQSLPPLVVAAIAAGDRMQEYGVAARGDYQGRGRKAKAYARYVTTELIPWLQYRFPISTDPADHAIGGYSLGGLSAMDIVWNHPEVFSKAGVFSGSFWWRRRDAQSMFYSDHRDRLMHLQVRKGRYQPGLRFWFQTGTEDEASDRNKNGVIDSIDDTLDLIVELTRKGYRPFHDIQYLEIKGGRHHVDTWAQALPDFLQWAFVK